MASTTYENYVTETIFVPLYNRSEGFRKLIEKAFPKGQRLKFGKSVYFTGNVKNTEETEKYGCPDAKSDSGNYIELKINSKTRLTDSETRNGNNGNGYVRFLKENKDKYLLYVIPKDYERENFVKDKQRVGVITWQEILKYLIEQNKEDPYIGLICDKVEGIGKMELETLSSYKAKVYETLIKCVEEDTRLHIHLNANDDSIINNFPKKMTNDDFDVIFFNYNESKDKFGIYFEKNNISFYIERDYIDGKGIKNLENFIADEYGWLQLKILSQEDFLKWNTNRIAKEINKKLKVFIKTINMTK